MILCIYIYIYIYISFPLSISLLLGLASRPSGPRDECREPVSLFVFRFFLSIRLSCFFFIFVICLLFKYLFFLLFSYFIISLAVVATHQSQIEVWLYSYSDKCPYITCKDISFCTCIARQLAV